MSPTRRSGARKSTRIALTLAGVAALVLGTGYLLKRLGEIVRETGHAMLGGCDRETERRERAYVLIAEQTFPEGIVAKAGTYGAMPSGWGCFPYEHLDFEWPKELVAKYPVDASSPNADAFDAGEAQDASDASAAKEAHAARHGWAYGSVTFDGIEPPRKGALSCEVGPMRLDLQPDAESSASAEHVLDAVCKKLKALPEESWE